MKVKQLQLTKVIFMPGFGNLPSTLGTIHFPAEMTLKNGYVECVTPKGAFFIPFHMIQGGPFEQDAPKTSKKA